MSRAAVIFSRRRFLGFLVVGGPTLAIGARLGLDGAVGNGASGVEVGVPEVNDAVDLSDVFVVSGEPFAYDLMIEITPENRVRFEVPAPRSARGWSPRRR